MSASTESIPPVRFETMPLKQKKDLNNQECIICYEDLTNNVVSTRCNHLFHKHCVQDWVINRKKNVCPYCTQQNPLLGAKNIVYIESNATSDKTSKTGSNRTDKKQETPDNQTPNHLWTRVKSIFVKALPFLLVFIGIVLFFYVYSNYWLCCTKIPPVVSVI